MIEKLGWVLHTVYILCITTPKEKEEWNKISSNFVLNHKQQLPQLFLITQASEFTKTVVIWVYNRELTYRLYFLKWLDFPKVLPCFYSIEILQSSVMIFIRAIILIIFFLENHSRKVSFKHTIEENQVRMLWNFLIFCDVAI